MRTWNAGSGASPRAATGSTCTARCVSRPSLHLRSELPPPPTGAFPSFNHQSTAPPPIGRSPSPLCSARGPYRKVKLDDPWGDGAVDLSER
jgi:hypothetical protein